MPIPHEEEEEEK
jgi:hypothetical protein